MPDSGNMPATDTQEPADLLRLALPISQKVVLVIDLVESVRLMAADESGTVARWHDFAQAAQQHTIPKHHGRLVKSLGDGLMVEFDNSRDAANAAYNLHGLMGKANRAQPPERHMHLRAGINATHVYTDNNDIYGAGVNLAARIATLAGPGETVVTAPVRDGLTDGLDATVEDLGECYLKHIDEPVRAYRVGAAGLAPVVIAQQAFDTSLEPTIAVIPFDSRNNSQEHFAIGELIADGVIGCISNSPHIRVISRLSTTQLRGRNASVAQIQAGLGANFILSGSYAHVMNRLLITSELAEARTGEVIWSDRFEAAMDDLFSQDSELSQRLAESIQANILRVELQRVRLHPLPTLQSYSLMLAGVGLMHQSTQRDFDRSRQALVHLIERHSRSPHARAWLAKWHVLRSTRGMATDAAAEGRLAIDNTRRALDIDPHNSLALAMEGFVYCHLVKDLDTARSRLDQACEVNPSEAMAWLFQSVVHSFAGDAQSAVKASERALMLSPLDPLRYYYESLAASSALCAGDYGRAVELCESSLRRNRTHASTLRALITARVGQGDFAKANQAAQALMRLSPGFTVNTYKNLSASTAYPFGQQVAEALIAAGIPEN
jgi:adenylate cyclase